MTIIDSDILAECKLNDCCDQSVIVSPGNTLPCIRTYIDKEVLTFDDITILTLSPPAGSNLAEMQVQGGDIVFDYNNDLANGTILCDLGTLEIESADAISAFSMLGRIGQSGKVVIYYFNDCLDQNV